VAVESLGFSFEAIVESLKIEKKKLCLKMKRKRRISGRINRHESSGVNHNRVNH
jgi:hypothetical protein